MAQYWLLKTEPETYSFSKLLKDKKTNWNGVRNFQARNNLQKMKSGDVALIYHSGDDKSVVGIAKVVKEAYKDQTPEDDREWAQIDIAPVKALKKPVTLATIKTASGLTDLPLIKQSRLSVMPISEKHFQKILTLGDTSA
jgi:predicted RNA-binding protein with PUA-like domain